MEKREPSYIAGWNVSWYSHYGGQYGGSSKNWSCHMTQYKELIIQWQKANNLIHKWVITSKRSEEVKSLSRVWLFATPWTVAYQAPLSMWFSRQECWSGLPFHLQGIFPTQESNWGLPHCRQTLYRLSHQGSPLICRNLHTVFYSNDSNL